MSFATVLNVVMLVFALIGAIDRILGCKFGPGKSFEQGFETCGPLVLVMAGPVFLAPLIATYLSPLLAPICTALGLDPSLPAGLMLANDSGGWTLSMALAQDPAIGALMGSTVASTMGCAVMFALPMGFSATPKDKRPFIAKGMAIGLTSVPICALTSGILLGIPPLALLRNLLPILLISLLFVLGLLFLERFTVGFITVLGRLLTAILTLALMAAMVIKVMKWEVSGVGTFDETMLTIGSIAIFLAGAFPMLRILRTLLAPFLNKLSAKTGLAPSSLMGLLTGTVNSIPVFAMTSEMDERGVVLNAAYMIPASFLLGDHLAYQAAEAPETALPLMVGKLFGGIFALALALVLTKERKSAAISD